MWGCGGGNTYEQPVSVLTGVHMRIKAVTEYEHSNATS